MATEEPYSKLHMSIPTYISYGIGKALQSILMEPIATSKESLQFLRLQMLQEPTLTKETFDSIIRKIDPSISDDDESDESSDDDDASEASHQT
jgi:hypothetical protein